MSLATSSGPLQPMNCLLFIIPRRGWFSFTKGLKSSSNKALKYSLNVGLILSFTEAENFFQVGLHSPNEGIQILSMKGLTNYKHGCFLTLFQRVYYFSKKRFPKIPHTKGLNGLYIVLHGWELLQHIKEKICLKIP